ncbi:MAG: SEL1-like repeat protein [Hyphomonadaceae bacterium]|nr:SEL1-like repeat protein [Hyphomonadaceae bacterium]
MQNQTHRPVVFAIFFVVAMVALVMPSHAQPWQRCAREHMEAQSAGQQTLGIAAPEAEVLIREIASAIGLRVESTTLVPCHVVRQVETIATDGSIPGVPAGEYVFYNETWVRQVIGTDRNQAIALFGHELGHLLNRDFYPGRNTLARNQRETDADQFAGCAVAVAGNGDWAALESLLTRLRETREGTYPTRARSLEAARRGFDLCAHSAPTQSASATSQTPSSRDPAAAALRALDQISDREWGAPTGADIRSGYLSEVPMESLRAAAGRDPRAQWALGGMYQYGERGLQQDPVEAVRWYRRGAAQGFARAQNALGNAYMDGLGVTRDYGEALRLFRLAAAQGDVYGQINVGFLYDHGFGVPQDYGEAARLYQLAVDRGNAVAQHNLGILYRDGHGVPQNYSEALRLFRAAANQGYANAQSSLGRMYANGWGVAQDYAEAIRLYRLAVTQNYPGAQFALALIHERGTGVRQDYGEAARLYRLAADQGNTHAQVNLGVLYETGQGVPQDYAEAIRLYRLAADQGNSFGQANLGNMYAYGWGVTQDDAEAIRLYRLAADQGNENAQNALNELLNR